MLVTSAEAAKMLKKWNEDLNAIYDMESEVNYFIASISEDPEDVRPEYDYAEVQKQKVELEVKIRKMKHSLNLFNTTTIVPEFDMTIDELLVYLPQLNKRSRVLYGMKQSTPKKREENYNSRSSIIDYRYANYDIAAATNDYDALFDELQKAQTALDVVNNTIKFEVDI